MQHRRRQTAHSTSVGAAPDLDRRKFLQGVGLAATAAASGLGGMVGSASRLSAGEIGPVSGQARLDAAHQYRLDAADRMLDAGVTDQTPNGDEDLYNPPIGNFSKSLRHNALGEPRRVAYQSLLTALASGEQADFDQIQRAGARKLVSPQAGYAFDTEGLDPQQYAAPAAPAFASAETAAEMVELYWMALLRDVPFDRYEGNPMAEAAAAELSSLADFKGPKEGGAVTTQTLFRDLLPGCTDGPYLSQFMLLGTPFGAEFVERRMRTVVPGLDYGTTFGEWLQIQSGNVPRSQVFDSTRRYIRNGRDLSEWVHIDVLFQAYFNACLILGTPPSAANQPTGGGMACPFNSGNPYAGAVNEDPFATWGPPAVKALLCEVASRGLKATWFQKWQVHRRLRPEEYAGRVHVRLSGQASYPLHPQVLESEVADRLRSKNGSWLLPLAFPEGSPIHPSYTAGHATVAGACVTILKALFDEDFVIPHPVQVKKTNNNNGLALEPYTGAPLTVGGELNKLASNVGTGRNVAGVHWRSDALESFRIGEAVAIAILRDHKKQFNEGGGYTFTKFDGSPITI